MASLHIHAAAGTHAGYRRTTNQDASLIRNGIYLVCDGMGGGVGGRRASIATISRFSEFASGVFRNRPAIERTIDAAQRDVLAVGTELGGVSGTTVTGLICPFPLADGMSDGTPSIISGTCEDAGDWYVVNIGDSRTYHLEPSSDGRWNASSLLQITHDHSRRQEAIDSGRILPQDAAIIPRNIITRCIGDPNDTRADFYAVAPSGRFIICSDGLHGEVDDAVIGGVAASTPDPRRAAEELIRISLQAGGNDNITVIVVDITNDDPPSTDWHVNRLADDEDLGTISDDTLNAIRVQTDSNG